MFNMENLYEAVGDMTQFNIFVAVSLIFYLITFILIVVSICKIFANASRPGGYALVPFLNFWIWFEISGISGFWSLIPIANVILLIVSLFRLPKRFGKNVFNGLGILFIPYLFLPYIAFNKKLKYVKPEPKRKKTKNEKKKNKKEKNNKNEEIIEILELEPSIDEEIEVLEMEGEIIEILDEEQIKK